MAILKKIESENKLIGLKHKYITEKVRFSVLCAMCITELFQARKTFLIAHVCSTVQYNLMI